MSTPLLATKFYIPRTRPELVPRPRLIERLDQGRRCTLTLLSAPAGFGKTTLLAEWIVHLQPSPPTPEAPVTQIDPIQNHKSEIQDRIAWLSLDEDDDDPARFLAYLAGALRTLVPGLGLDAHETRPAAFQPALAVLINELAVLPDRLLLVLDDYHLISAAPIHEALGFLLDHLPPNLHVVVATRVDPPLPLSRYRARGQMAELREPDLRFTADEASAFLNRVMDLNLSQGDIAALEARTEGWIAGLQLAALSMRGRDDAATFVQAFSGSHRYVVDYLTEEVLQRQAEAVRRFLVQTAILERLSGPLCDAVTGGDDGATRLNQLERDNLFLVALDDRRVWYRYHHLFAEFLQAHLQRVDPGQIPVLHRRAAGWYEAHGLAAEAIDHALAAQDFDGAARLIEAVAETTLKRSEITTFLRWAEALPDELACARPSLCLYHAWALLLAGRPLADVLTRLQHAEPGGEAGSVQTGVLRAFIAAFQGQVPQAEELSRLAEEQLPEDDRFLRSVVAWNVGFAHIWQGEFAAGSQALDRAIRLAQETGNVLVGVVALCQLAEVRLIQGHLRLAEALYDQALALAVDGRGARLPIAGMALIGLGELWREWNDLERAARLLQEGIELTRQWGEIGSLDGHIALARVRQAQGDEAGANEAIQAARQLAVRFDTTEMDDRLVAVHQARLWLAQGKLQEVEAWRDQPGLRADAGAQERRRSSSGESFSLAYIRELEHLALARLLLCQGRPGEALLLLDGLLPATGRQDRKGSAIEILLLQALALQKQGDEAGALESLAAALALAEPEGYVRTFVDEGEALVRLLRRAAAQGIAVSYAASLLAALGAGHAERSGDSPLARHEPALVEALSERELEVLRLVAAGLSNREIAEEFVVAVSTVKWHINNVFGKLGVRSRTQAVARARELQLL